MSAILRIFKYVRKRLIILSIENKRLKMQLEFYKAIVESDNSKNINATIRTHLYGRKKIKVIFKPLKNLDGYYETEKKIIVLIAE